MSFTGSLAHLPIPDVIQLLESTKKTGTLTVKNSQFEYRFGLAEGLIISVSHPDTTDSLAKIITDEKIVDEKTVLDALKMHGETGKPLLALLFEKNQINKEGSFKALSSLVIMTVVDILKWNEGSFELDVTKQDVSEEFACFRELTGQNIYISTQNTLMEALRIFDELRRDKKLDNEIFRHRVEIQQQGIDSIIISEDILGLDNIDKLERKIPDVFTGIKLTDPREAHIKKIKGSYPDLPDSYREALADYIFSLEERKKKDKLPLSVIFYSNDDFASYLINIMGTALGYFVFTTDGEENLSVILNQSINKNLKPLVIIDTTEEDRDGFSASDIKGLIKRLELSYSDLTFLKLVKPEEPFAILKNIQQEEVISIPKTEPHKANLEDTLLFYSALYTYLLRAGREAEDMLKLAELLAGLKDIQKIADLLDLSASYLGSYFKRQILFLVRKDELKVEKVIGINDINLPLSLSFEPECLLSKSLKSGKIFFGEPDDETKKVINKISELAEQQKIILIPLSGMEKTIAMIYADSCYRQFSINHIKILQNCANMALGALLYRKMFEKIKTQ